MILGRKREIALLNRAFASKEAQFLTVYGRRRVGKTYLIREYFKQQPCIFLHVTGLQHGNLRQQLDNFTQAFSKTFYNKTPLLPARDWSDALRLLTLEIDKYADQKVVIFFDELPWMATPKSRLMDTIDFYWNNQWAGNHNIIFIACGSSASWLLKNIIYHKGGLHNRTTIEIKLAPFKLAETREYLEAKGVKLNDKHILSLYMAIGGIPYYLDYIKAGLTAQQNIQQLFFDEYAPLKSEYDKLFESLFDGAIRYKELVEAIAKKKEGVSRGEIVAHVEHTSEGGLLSERLKKLCDAGFIEEYRPWGKTIGSYYKVVDEFCLFYIRWILSNSGEKFDADHWIIHGQRPTYYAWAGYAFEAVCSKHTHEIIRSLGIRGVNAISSWRFAAVPGKESGAQIDLLIDRIDNAITLCEMKYTEKPFIIDKKYALVLEQKIEIFQRQTKTAKQIFFAMVSASGVQKSMYSEEMLSSVATLEDLFKAYK